MSGTQLIIIFSCMLVAAVVIGSLQFRNAGLDTDCYRSDPTLDIGRPYVVEINREPWECVMNDGRELSTTCKKMHYCTEKK